MPALRLETQEIGAGAWRVEGQRPPSRRQREHALSQGGEKGAESFQTTQMASPFGFLQTLEFGFLSPALSTLSTSPFPRCLSFFLSQECWRDHVVPPLRGVKRRAAGSQLSPVIRRGHGPKNQCMPVTADSTNPAYTMFFS